MEKGLSSLRNQIGEELIWENNGEVSWREYYVQMLNGDEISEIGVRRKRIAENE